MKGINENNLPGLSDPQKKREGHQKIELFISCRQLKNRDLISLSDPQVKIFTYEGDTEKFFGETEMILDSLNPDFLTTFSMDYIFEVKQRIHFQIIDVDPRGRFDLLGDVYTSLGDIMGGRNQILVVDIQDKGKKAGKLILRTEIVEGVQEFISMDVMGKNIPKTGWFSSKSNPFLQLSRVHGENTNVIVHQTEVMPRNIDPTWKPFTISMKTLCNNDRLRPIQFSVYHKNMMSSKLLGQCSLSVDDLQNHNEKDFPLKKPKTKNKTYGSIQVQNVSISEKPTFLEYLRRGIQLNVVTAIDFTSSNGNPKSITSLHALKKDGKFNDYQSAIHGVCDILLCYDYDKKIPMYGFGGKPAGTSHVSHCFPLAGAEDSNYADGLDGVMSVYQNCLNEVTLSSPTYFKNVLRKGMDTAAKAKEDKSLVYTILLVLTDGLIHDMQPTIDCLVECADLPMSVIIIGVGDEDFSLMQTLDGDHGAKLHNSKGEASRRDLTQFVAFNKYKGDKAALAEEVLAEVPRQMLEYMQSQGIHLEDPQKIDINNLKFSRAGDLEQIVEQSQGPAPRKESNHEEVEVLENAKPVAQE